MPKRKRAPKLKLNADMTYLAANVLLEDGGPLASFNAFYEIQNGRLSTPDGEGHEASREKDVTLAGMIAYVVLPSEQFSLRRAFPCELDTEDIYARCATAIRALPSGTLAEEGGGHGEVTIPMTIGAAALWQKSDGSSWTVFYHHPGVTPGLAAAILKDVVDDFEKEDAEADSSEGPKN